MDVKVAAISVEQLYLVLSPRYHICTDKLGLLHNNAGSASIQVEAGYLTVRFQRFQPPCQVKMLQKDF